MAPAPVICVTHGGGPMPILKDPSQKDITLSLSTKVPKILKLGTSEAPKAIVLVTAHWEMDVITISNGSKHDLYYDYGGFPAEAYKLKYNASGSPEVADTVAKALKAAGLRSVMDSERGWDHGVFIPLLLINPAADIPIVQVSVLRSQSPAELYAMGRALAPLRSQNIAIIGSGSASFHHVSSYFNGKVNTPSFRSMQKQWSATLEQAIGMPQVDQREERLLAWKQWEGSAQIHPRGAAEHFSPLVVCAGAAGDGVVKGWNDEMMRVPMRTFYWD
ncbi:hypothetical protein MMC26_005368 [Xylographa opegraphella]|nr:hypothetical protein [Xylographa opegraphella]